MYQGLGQFQILFCSPKTWNTMCTWDLASCRYLFSHSKPESQDVFVIWPVLGSFLPTQNMKRNVYLQPVLVFSPKTWSAICTWDLANRRCLFPQSKPEAWYVLETWLVAGTYFYIKNMKPGMYLRLGRSQVPISYQKYEVLGILTTNTFLSNKYIRRRVLAGYRNLFSHSKY